MGLRPKVRICPWRSSYMNYRKSLLLLHPCKKPTTVQNTAWGQTALSCSSITPSRKKKQTSEPWQCHEGGFSGRWLEKPHSPGDSKWLYLGTEMQQHKEWAAENVKRA